MSLVLERLTKLYAGTPVVNDVSVQIADGEYFVLLGSSGSGKTTVLNIVAGLAAADSGQVLLKDVDVTWLPPQRRNMGFVFQNYALFQHMSVADNVEFGLRVRRVPADERRRRRDDLLELVGLMGLGHRLPRQLSGGQQQRVALARALAARPDVLLLDEPLGALDAKTRLELRRTLKEVQQELGVTTIHVTHDQEEAFELADRLGVMSFGRLLEVGSPETLYDRPKTEFVATFLGTANVLLGRRDGDKVRLGSLELPPPSESGASHPSAQVLFRPEDVVLSDSSEGGQVLGEGRVESVVFSGALERVVVRLPVLAGVRAIAPPVEFGDEGVLVEVARLRESARELPLHVGSRVWVRLARAHALEHTGLRLVLLTDSSAPSVAALSFGGLLARLAHARTTILCVGPNSPAMERHTQEARELVGSGMISLDTVRDTNSVARALMDESEREPFDVVVCGASGESAGRLAQDALRAGRHHVLIVPRSQGVPTRALICVAAGEPGKDDVLFAGRFLRHLGAEATVLWVPRPDASKPDLERGERFLAQSVISLAGLGVRADAEVGTGPVPDEVSRRIKAGTHDFVVMGAPLVHRSGLVESGGVVSQVLLRGPECATLLVRYQNTREVY